MHVLLIGQLLKTEMMNGIMETASPTSEVPHSLPGSGSGSYGTLLATGRLEGPFCRNGPWRPRCHQNALDVKPLTAAYADSIFVVSAALQSIRWKQFTH